MTLQKCFDYLQSRDTEKNDKQNPQGSWIWFTYGSKINDDVNAEPTYYVEILNNLTSRSLSNNCINIIRKKNIKKPQHLVTSKEVKSRLVGDCMEKLNKLIRRHKVLRHYTLELKAFKLQTKTSTFVDISLCIPLTKKEN